MADSPSRRTRVRPPCPGVVGRGTMDDRRQPGGATIVAAPGGGRRAARGGKSSAGTSSSVFLLFIIYSCTLGIPSCREKSIGKVLRIQGGGAPTRYILWDP